MKRLLLSLNILLGFCLICQAQDFKVSESFTKINAAGRSMIVDFKGELEEYHKKVIIPGFKTMTAENTQPPVEPTVSAVVILEEGYGSDVLNGFDLEVLSEMDGVLVVRCPLTVTEQIAGIPQVVSIGFNDKMNVDMDFARPSGKVSDVQNGFSYNGQTMSFDGTGVICGMMDTGLEANHINFKNADGSSRIKRLWFMNSTDGSSVEYTDQTVKNFTTDTRSESHATHVAGIIGGSYKGNGTYNYTSTATASSYTQKVDQPIPYYGVATGSDLAFAVGELYTDNIIKGVTNIIEYAESVGKPVVVNLSLGHVIGPHDGSDYYCQALSRLGKRGIICMSAGNDGGKNLSIIKKIDTSTTTGSALRTFPFSLNTAGEVVYGSANGVMDIWSSTGEQVTFSLKAFSGGSVNNAVEILTLDTQGSVSTSGNDTFSKYFSGSVTIQGYKDPGNNRFEVYVTFSNLAMLPANTTHVLMIEAKAADGTTLYAFGNNVFFYNKMSASASTTLACSEGSAENSINDGACADNLISVGAYTSRQTWGQFDTETYTYSYKSKSNVNLIAPFSSYGQKFVSPTESVNLPLISGPGSTIVSSYSSYYLGSNTGSMTGKAVVDGSTYWWGQMQGTSMSCPFVTGTIGLWLQADPTLDFNRVMEVINNTSTYGTNRLVQPYNGSTADKKKWGAGAIDALAGIKYVLDNRAAIGEVWADDSQRLIVTRTDGGYEVFVADSGELTATLYDLQGRPVAAAHGTDGTVTIETGQLQHGVYILEARTPSLRLTRKVTL